MSTGINKVIIMGRIGNEPELRQVGDSQLLRLRVATGSRYRDRNEMWQERTDWHTVLIWGKRGEALAMILGRGDQILVHGELRTSSYEKDGIKRYTTDIRASEVQLVSRVQRPDPGHDGGATAAPRMPSVPPPLPNRAVRAASQQQVTPIQMAMGG